MRAFYRCLCLILTLWMAGSRPSAAIRNGSPESDPWWGTKDAREIKRATATARQAGDFAAVEAAALRGYELAVRDHALLPAVRYLIYIGGARLLQYHYRGALDAFLRAEKLANSIGDRLDSGAIAGNLSSLYLEMSDVSAAFQYAERARAISRQFQHPYF